MLLLLQLQQQQLLLLIIIITIIIIDYELIDDRFILAGVSINKVGLETIMASLSENHKLNGCLPSFAFFRFKALVTFVGGVDAPTIVSQISINMPDKPEPVEQ
jgi:hypothetical protein